MNTRKNLNVVVPIALLLLLFLLGNTGNVAAREAVGALVLDNDTTAVIYVSPQDPSSILTAPTACPAGPGGTLTSTVERTKFCVYYNPAVTSLAEATTAADHIENKYWPELTTQLGKEPKYSVKLEVHLLDTAGCNGATGWSVNYMTTYDGCITPDILYQKVLGHELTHRVQYNHDDGPAAPHQTKTFKEGTARAIEDLFAPQDTWVGALGYSSYASQAQTALNTPNTDWWAYGWRYNYAIAWKYYSEQLPGGTMTEPGYGWDYFETLYAATTNHVGIAAVNNAHATLGGPSHYEMWKKFARVLYTRDLNVASLPSQEYYILDEQQAGDQPGPVAKNPGGTIDSSTPASWTGESVSKDGMDYYEAAVDSADCEVATVSFSNATGHPYFWVITRDGNDYLYDVGGSGTNWSQSIVIGDQSHLAAVVVGLDADVTVDVEMSCASPVMDIKQPLQLAPDYVQSLDVVVVQVLVTNGSPTAPVVSGLSYTDFEAEIDGTPALILGGGFVEEQYFLLVQAPNLTNGPKDLEILLNQPGTATTIASDSETEAVVYDLSNTDNVLVIDRSGSMGWGTTPSLPAAQAAARLFIDASNSSEGLAVVPYNHDVDPTPLDMDVGTLPHRIAAKAFVDGLTASGATSIGDGLDEAADQCTTSLTGNTRCLMILLSDGMENSYLMWSDVMTDVINAGQVMAIALGPSADETLMQSIATATGGASYYNDVYVSTRQRAPGAPLFTVDDMYFDLGRTYLSSLARGEERDEFLSEKGVIPLPMVVQTHTVMIDATTTEALFALDWNQQGIEMYFRLRKPDGTIISDTVATPYAFEDYTSSHLGWRITAPDPGVWELLVGHQGGAKAGVPYQVLVSGHTSLSVELLLPDWLETDYTTGQQVPIRALIPIAPGAGVQLADVNEGARMAANAAAADSISIIADVTAPDGIMTQVPLFDDGQHDDGKMGDGLYAGVYTLVTQAKEEGEEGETGQISPTLKTQGAYRVVLMIHGPTFQREVLGSFAVLEGDDSNPADGIPDVYTQINGPGNEDPDLDALMTADEYFAGTNPLHSDSDSDDGVLRESDWSEIQNVLDPLDSSDDMILAPETCQVLGQDGLNLLVYDVKPEYDSMRAYGSVDGGAWNLYVASLPLNTGGVYTDTPVTNGSTYEYQIQAISGTHVSALVPCGIANPSANWRPPSAWVSVAVSQTAGVSATLSFGPYEGEDGQADFDAIDEMWITADADSVPAPGDPAWQSFAPSVPYQPGVGQTAVYVWFKDVGDNLSTGPAVGNIPGGSNPIYLPLIVRQS